MKRPATPPLDLSGLDLRALAALVSTDPALLTAVQEELKRRGPERAPGYPPTVADDTRAACAHWWPSSP